MFILSATLVLSFTLPASAQYGYGYGYNRGGLARGAIAGIAIGELGITTIPIFYSTIMNSCCRRYIAALYTKYNDHPPTTRRTDPSARTRRRVCQNESLRERSLRAVRWKRRISAPTPPGPIPASCRLAYACAAAAVPRQRDVSWSACG